jgi:hypothetical protein
MKCGYQTKTMVQPSFGSAHAFLKKVDSLQKGPAWDYRRITVTGDCMDENGKLLTEDLELWLRNPVECIAQLISNPAFEKSMSYVPERVYADSAGIIQRHDEMWTADWWWDIQVSMSMI